MKVLRSQCTAREREREDIAAQGRKAVPFPSYERYEENAADRVRAWLTATALAMRIRGRIMCERFQSI